MAFRQVHCPSRIGNQSRRAAFEFRNQPGQSYQQWLYVNLHIAAAQASLVAAGVVGIRFKAKADSNRTLRVDIESQANPETNKGVCIGWDVSLTTEPKEVVVSFDTGAIPSWRLNQSPPPTTTDRTAVYQSASGLKLRLLPKGIGSDGLFPDGVTDPGFVEIGHCLAKKGRERFDHPRPVEQVVTAPGNPRP